MQDRPFFLYLTASLYTFTTFLTQNDDSRKEWVVYYIICVLVDYETCYSSSEKQFLALIFVIQNRRHYLLHYKTHFIVKTNLLKNFFSSVDLVGRLAKWLMLLFEFGIKLTMQKLIKGQVVVDQLVNILPSHSFLDLDLFPNKDISTSNHDLMWKIYFNGSRC